LICLDLEGYPDKTKESVIKNINFLNIPLPTLYGNEGKTAITAVGNITGTPTVKLIGPDKKILATSGWTNVSVIESAIKQAGIKEKTCTPPVISDTIQPTRNLVTAGAWEAEVDNENAGSKIVSPPQVAGGVMSSSVYVGHWVYPDGPWTYGKVTVPVGKILSGKRYIKVTYKVNDDLLLELPMPQTDAIGENYGKRLPTAADWTTIILDLQTFAQPP
jgi:hypothetical protein